VLLFVYFGDVSLSMRSLKHITTSAFTACYTIFRGFWRQYPRVRSKCTNSTSGRKSVTGKGFSDIDYRKILAVWWYYSSILAMFHCAYAVSAIFTTSDLKSYVVFQFNASDSTRTSLRYVLVFAIANPSVSTCTCTCWWWT